MSTALDIRNGHADLPSQDIAHAIAGAMEQLKAIRTFVKEQFDTGHRDRDGKWVPGIDAGVIPGCGDKPTLFLPGAQKATMYFNCFPTYKVKEKDLGGGNVEYRVRCMLISRATREQVGEGIGCASTKEKKFKRGGAAKPCPTCNAPAIMKSKEEYGGGWYCNKKSGGCGAKFAKKHKGLADAREVEVADDSAYEMHNTVLKMAKKRAHVDAAMTLGCLSELFTQDIEDTYASDAVREAARPYDGEVWGDAHANHDGSDVVLVPPTGTPRPQNRGFFSQAGLERTEKFLAWLDKQVKAVNLKWQEEWQPRIDRMMESVGYAPEVPEIINKFGFKGHLLKWAKANGHLDPSVQLDNVRSREAEAYLAAIYEAMKDEVIAELGSYLQDKRAEIEAKIFAKHPEMAPAGHAEEQAEATNSGITAGFVDGIEYAYIGDGRELLAWIKEQEQLRDVGLHRYINSWAKLQDYPGRMIDWEPEQVSQAHKEAIRKLLSIPVPEAADHGDAYEPPAE